MWELYFLPNPSTYMNMRYIPNINTCKYMRHIPNKSKFMDIRYIMWCPNSLINNKSNHAFFFCILLVMCKAWIKKYDSLSGNLTHPRATSTAMLLAGLCHKFASGLATPCSILSTIHPNVDDGPHSTNTWHPPILGHQPPQTVEELCTPLYVEVHLKWDLSMRFTSHQWPSKTNKVLDLL